MPVFTMGELLKRNDKVEYLLPPFLTKGGTLLMSAPLKSMKSFLGLHMATAIASGKPFIDMPTQQTRVLYIDYELGIAEAKTRVTPLAKHFGETDDFLIRTTDEVPISLDAGSVGSSNLFDLLKDVRPQVVFFDTLRMSTQGDENSSTDMMKVFNRLRELKLKFGFTAVVIHHMGKEPSEQQTAPRTSRGSSVIEDSPDTIGYITKHVTGDDEPPRLSIRWKFRNHAPIPNSRFTFDPASGLFIRTPAEKRAVKEKGNGKQTKIRVEAESIDISDGLLSAVRD
jgi:RecA-family ATPase